MQVRVMDGGADTFNALVYAPPSQDTLNYIKGSISNMYDRLGQMATGFVDRAKEAFDHFNSSSALIRNKLLAHDAGLHIQETAILPLRRENIRNANFRMREYIYANPEIGKLYNKNLLNNYEDTFADPEDGRVKDDRFTYRQVMDGVLNMDDVGDIHIAHYNDIDEENELDIYDQNAILDTWETVAILLAEGLDPTDPELGEL